MKNDKKRAPEVPVPGAQKYEFCSCGRANYSIQNTHCQPYFEKVKNELCEKLQPNKIVSEVLAESYKRLGLLSRWERVLTCSTYLQFQIPINEKGQPIGDSKILQANFCKDRLCPMCAYRRSRKIFSQVSRIIKAMPKEFDYLMLTLTIPNVDGCELSNSIDKLMKGIDVLFKRRSVKRAVKGYFRALEITRNSETNTYHPHYHFILAVNKSYFTSREYITQPEWLDMWRQAMNDESITQVDIRKINPSEDKKTPSEDTYSKAVAEVAKYTVKSDDYIIKGDDALTDEIVRILTSATAGRRLVHLSGIFKQVAKQLKLDNMENGDLVNVDGELDPIVRSVVIDYRWGVGFYKPYKAIFIDIATSDINPDRPSGSVEFREFFIRNE